MDDFSCVSCRALICVKEQVQGVEPPALLNQRSVSRVFAITFV